MPEENPTPSTPSAPSAQNNGNTPNASNSQNINSAPNPQNADNTPATDTTQSTTAPTEQATPSEAPATPEPTQQPVVTPTNLTDTPAPMSSPIMKSKVRKPKNILIPVIILLALLALAGLGASIFAFIQNSNKDSEIARLRSELANQGVILPVTPDNNDKNDQPTSNEPEITSAIRAKVLASVPTNLVISDAKSMNTTGEMSYIASGYFDNAFSANLDLTTNQATLTINWDRTKEIYPYLETDKTGSENISDLDLSGKPTDMLLTGFGQAVGYEAIFFLMEDGTVEYIPLAKATKEGRLKSYGKLSNVNNVIKFYSANSCSKTGPGCGRQSLAQRADGNYYELYEAVNTTGNFNL